MYKLYVVSNTVSGRQYIGITKNTLAQRFASHKNSAKSGKNTPFYAAMRKYGVDKFVITEVCTYNNFEDCAKAEIAVIASDTKLYNIALGGNGGYVVPEDRKDEWRAKLRSARVGRKPALGMKHSVENKKFFAECNKRKVLLYPSDVINIPFKEAHAQYNISKTHYYRLLKRASSNETS